MPLGLIACFHPLTDASLFLVLYGVASAYFSGVMVSAPSSPGPIALPSPSACSYTTSCNRTRLTVQPVSWPYVS